MTKEEIERAASNTTQYGDDITSAILFEEGYIAGAEMVNEKQPYSAEDMVDFGVELLKRTHVTANRFVVKANLKLWEESKNG